MTTGQTIACWGSDGNRVILETPATGTFTLVSSGNIHACALKTGGTVQCWGGVFLQGNENVTHSAAVAPSGTFTTLDAGPDLTCGIKSDGTLECWGATTHNRQDEPTGSFTRVAVGASHVCAIKIDQSIVCWGEAVFFDKDGDGTPDDIGGKGNHTSTIPPTGGHQYTAISAGEGHTCAIRTDKKAVCWGYHADTRYAVPGWGSDAQGFGSIDYKAVATGGQPNCAIKESDGSLSCWNTEKSQYLPGEEILAMTGFKSLGSGSHHMCAIDSGDGLVCWGAAGIIPFPAHYGPPPNTGGGGGGPRIRPDRHGDTPDEATVLNPWRYTTGSIRRRINAWLQSRADIDYFQVDIPHVGVLTASTTGGDTTDQLWQAHADGDPTLVPEDTNSGPSRNFRLGAAVEPGTYFLAVSAGATFGNYRLLVDYTPAFFDTPAPASHQSGLGVVSGWVCAADRVEIQVETAGAEPLTLEAATNTSRADTAAVCDGTTDTGFGLLYNWNLLGDGEHTVRAVINGVVFAERDITVTTLGEHADQEFRRGLTGRSAIPDFPAQGQTTTLQWEEALQNFVLADGEKGSGGAQLLPEQAWLENPAPGSFQSGLGVVFGWVCEADTVEIVFENGVTGQTLTFEAGSGTERLDTADHCGDTDNGFELLLNWNLLGDGQHTVRALADGEEFAYSTVTVTTLGEEVARGLRKTHEVEDFPTEGQTVTVEWQEASQNFVITAVE